MKQKDAVVHFWTQGTEQGLTGKDLEAFVATEIFHGLQAGDIEHRNPAIKEDEKECQRYAKALVSNHFKKAKEINGGVKYIPSNPRGPIVKDAALKDLTICLKAMQGRDDVTQEMIQTTNNLIESRKAALEAAKPAKVAARKMLSIDEIQATLAKYNVEV